MRWILLLAILVIVLVALMPALRTSSLRVSGPRSPRRDELVKDPVCQTYVVLSRAHTAQGADGATVHFCSRECAERYRRGEGRT
jgi:YHS domain-containing protein